MKKHILILMAIAMMVSPLTYGQSSDYKVVFDITSSNATDQQAVIREAGLIKHENPKAQVEVVVYGEALDLVRKDRSSHAKEIKKLLAQNGISFKACHETMKRKQVDKSQLLPGVEIVPDGIYEIISKQKDGWGYIKVAY